MKYFVVLLVAIGIIGSVISDPHSGSGYQYQSSQSQVAPATSLVALLPTIIQLLPALPNLITNYLNGFVNTLSVNLVQNLVTRIVFNIINLIVAAAPPNAVVPVAVLVPALQALGNPTVGVLLTALFKLLGASCTALLKLLPGGLLALPLNGANLLQFIVSSIPAGTTALPFTALAQVLGSYLSQLLFSILLH